MKVFTFLRFWYGWLQVDSRNSFPVAPVKACLLSPFPLLPYFHLIQLQLHVYELRSGIDLCANRGEKMGTPQRLPQFEI